MQVNITVVHDSFPTRTNGVPVRDCCLFEVDHHFDYELDHHQRKYELRCESNNKSHYSVKLVRQEDGYTIPYGSVNTISLIALLRMGIVDDMRNTLYDQFLHLPLYEDMAPWNIGEIIVDIYLFSLPAT